jgi:hypothetical protein
MPLADDIDGCIDVVGIRLAALRCAIVAREWEAVEFQFDRVSRAVSKMKSVIECKEVNR